MILGAFLLSLANPLAARPIRLRLDRRYKPALLAASAALLFLTAYAAGLMVRPSEAYLRLQSNLIYNLVPLAALGLTIIPLRRSRGRERLGWLCLTAVLLTWQVGDWTFTYYDFVRAGDPPFPGFADAAYYPGYLAFIAAIPLLTFPRWRLQDRRWIIDAAVIMVVAGTIGWEFIMLPIIGENGGQAFAGAVALGYPLADLALLSTLVVTLYASGGRASTLALVLLAAGMFQIASDGAYSYVLNTTGYDNVGNPMELGWIAAYLLIAVCFLLPEEPAKVSNDVRPSAVGLVLPYALGVPLLALLITSAVRGHPSLVLLGGAIGAVALVILRQFLTLRDNLALLVRAANFDDLTGLPNRRRFEEDMRRHLSQSRGREAQGALFLLGLDDLKAINDSVGHRAGDEVIVKVARVLDEQRTEGARLARLEGDEFVVLLPNAGPQDAETAARRLLQTLRERPIVLEGQILRTTASAGIALLGQHGATVDGLLGCADLAMYEAKAAGGNMARLYDPSSGSQALSESRLMWKHRIGDALEHDGFLLLYQPIVNLRNGAVHEYEALLRMQDGAGQLITPGTFLPIAERFGLINDIDRWVLQQAIRLLARRQRQGLPTRLAVNLSGKAFEDHDLLPFIERELAASAADPTLLTLEVTETAAIADMRHAQQFIGSLRRLGCRFALDDFGVGFSSFAHLKHLAVDYLKIDGSFIRDLPRDQVDRQLVKAIVDLARGLGRQTVAEFVQEGETVRLLREIGVDYGQGYYLGKPGPVPELTADERADTRQAA